MSDPTPLSRKEEHMQQLSEADINVPEILKAHAAKEHAAEERAQRIETRLESIIASARNAREHDEFKESQRLLRDEIAHTRHKSPASPGSIISDTSSAISNAIEKVKMDFKIKKDDVDHFGA